jgi:hypothetical protein
MITLISYCRLMTAFFTYSAIGSEMLIIIFALMTCIIRSRRSSLLLVTLGVLIDTFVASIASYLSSKTLKYAEDSPTLAGPEVVFFEFFIFMLLSSYVFGRISISGESLKQDMWDKGSTFMRSCYISQFLFSGATGFLTLIHFVVFVALFFWALIKWPMQYLLNSEDFEKRLKTNVTLSNKFRVIHNATINMTKIAPHEN